MTERKACGMLIAATFAFGTLAPFVRNIPLSSGALALCRAGMAAQLLGGALVLGFTLWNELPEKTGG